VAELAATLIVLPRLARTGTPLPRRRGLDRPREDSSWTKLVDAAG